jgi:hypothetical protein
VVVGAVVVVVVVVDALALAEAVEVVDVRLDGAVVLADADGVAVAVEPLVEDELPVDVSVDVVAATVAELLRPPARATASTPAPATDPTAAETVIVLTRRRAWSRCRAVERVPPVGWVFFEFVMLRLSLSIQETS